jgi:DNA-binding XRE family transcriptional regulator
MCPTTPSVTCPQCKLVQFLTAAKRCRRCDNPIGIRCIEISLPPREMLFDPSNVHHLHCFLGSLILKMRRRTGFNQTQFATAIDAGHRSYISRVECGHVLPSLILLLRAAALLDIDGIYLRMRDSGR